MESKAFDRSMAITPTSFSLSWDTHQSSVSFTRAEQQEWLRRKPTYLEKKLENKLEKVGCIAVRTLSFEQFSYHRENTDRAIVSFVGDVIFLMDSQFSVHWRGASFAAVNG